MTCNSRERTESWGIAMGAVRRGYSERERSGLATAEMPSSRILMSVASRRSVEESVVEGAVVELLEAVLSHRGRVGRDTGRTGGSETGRIGRGETISCGAERPLYGCGEKSLEGLITSSYEGGGARLEVEEDATAPYGFGGTTGAYSGCDG
jgi:hypothetical protein